MLPDFFTGAVLEQETSSRETQSYSPNYSNSGSGTFVISVGGSLLYKEGVIDSQAVKTIADTISSLHSSGYKFCLVVGGGVLARDFVNASRELGSNNFELDEIGISATRLNAQLFIQALPSAFKEVLTDLKKSKTIIDSGKIPVYGGMIPGVTTDFDAVILAEYLGGTFINLSNVDGVYDSNPRDNPDAVLYRELSYNALIKILLKEETKPRQNLVLDVPAALILKRSKITGLFLNGSKLQNFESAVRGESFEGTIVSSSGADERDIPDSAEYAEEETEEPEEENDSEKETKKKKKPKSKPSAKRKKKANDDDDPDIIAMKLRMR